MSQALDAYLQEVARGLRGMPPGRRRLCLKELEAHLLDEAEARGLQDESGMATLLAEKEPAWLLAEGLRASDGQESTHRTETALVAGGMLGLATGMLLAFQAFPWYLALSFGVAHGLAVGAGLLWLRPRWQRLQPIDRLFVAILLGAILAIPLGFTRYVHFQGFLWSRLLYGAYTGYLVERHTGRRHPWWQVILEVGAFTALMLVVEFPLTQRLTRFTWGQVRTELIFNGTIAVALLGALRLKAALSRRYIDGDPMR